MRSTVLPDTVNRFGRLPLPGNAGCGTLSVMPLDEHDLDEEGEHDPDECELCIERSCSTVSQCRCGNCCERLILEATLRDGEREPRIAVECPPLRDFGPEPIGYLLNDSNNAGACHFFDRDRRLCTIYETRPLMCRLFNCDAERESEIYQRRAQ